MFMNHSTPHTTWSSKQHSRGYHWTPTPTAAGCYQSLQLNTATTNTTKINGNTTTTTTTNTRRQDGLWGLSTPILSDSARFAPVQTITDASLTPRTSHYPTLPMLSHHLDSSLSKTYTHTHTSTTSTLNQMHPSLASDILHYNSNSMVTSRQRQSRRVADGYSRRICCVEGCVRVDRGKGLCGSHGGGKRCHIRGCTKASRKDGLCYAHMSKAIARFQVEGWPQEEGAKASAGVDLPTLEDHDVEDLEAKENKENGTGAVWERQNNLLYRAPSFVNEQQRRRSWEAQHLAMTTKACAEMRARHALAAVLSSRSSIQEKQDFQCTKVVIPPILVTSSHAKTFHGRTRTPPVTTSRKLSIDFLIAPPKELSTPPSPISMSMPTLQVLVAPQPPPQVQPPLLVLVQTPVMTRPRHSSPVAPVARGMPLAPVPMESSVASILISLAN